MLSRFRSETYHKSISSQEILRAKNHSLDKIESAFTSWPRERVVLCFSHSSTCMLIWNPRSGNCQVSILIRFSKKYRILSDESIPGGVRYATWGLGVESLDWNTAAEKAALRVYEYTGMLVYWFHSTPIYRYTGILVYWYIGKSVGILVYRYTGGIPVYCMVGIPV